MHWSYFCISKSCKRRKDKGLKTLLTYIWAYTVFSLSILIQGNKHLNSCIPSELFIGPLSRISLLSIALRSFYYHFGCPLKSFWMHTRTTSTYSSVVSHSELVSILIKREQLRNTFDLIWHRTISCIRFSWLCLTLCCTLSDAQITKKLH